MGSTLLLVKRTRTAMLFLFYSKRNCKLYKERLFKFIGKQSFELNAVCTDIIIIFEMVGTRIGYSKYCIRTYIGVRSLCCYCLFHLVLTLFYLLLCNIYPILLWYLYYYCCCYRYRSFWSMKTLHNV